VYPGQRISSPELYSFTFATDLVSEPDARIRFLPFCLPEAFRAALSGVIHRSGAGSFLHIASWPTKWLALVVETSSYILSILLCAALGLDLRYDQRFRC
jgi:hypothetical protein